jgi:hypothetical protein
MLTGRKVLGLPTPKIWSHVLLLVLERASRLPDTIQSSYLSLDAESSIDVRIFITAKLTWKTMGINVLI